MTEQDMMLPLTFEGLERMFLDEITTLSREQIDAVDRENARHMERIVEINARYQEKLTATRVKQANKREEFLGKELQARFNPFTASTSQSLGPGTSVTDSLESVSVPYQFGSSVPSTSFGLAGNAGFSSGSSFGSTARGGASPFQFGGRPTMAAQPNPSPFQASGSREFNGGSFSLCANGGGGKSNSRIVRVKKTRRKRRGSSSH